MSDCATLATIKLRIMKGAADEDFIDLCSNFIKAELDGNLLCACRLSSRHKQGRVRLTGSAVWTASLC